MHKAEQAKKLSVLCGYTNAHKPRYTQKKVETDEARNSHSKQPAKRLRMSHKAELARSAEKLNLFSAYPKANKPRRNRREEEGD